MVIFCRAFQCGFIFILSVLGAGHDRPSLFEKTFRRLTHTNSDANTLTSRQKFGWQSSEYLSGLFSSSSTHNQKCFVRHCRLVVFTLMFPHNCIPDGIITETDLAMYHAEVQDDPLQIQLDDYTIYTPKPPASGAVASYIMNILDGMYLQGG